MDISFKFFVHRKMATFVNDHELRIRELFFEQVRLLDRNCAILLAENYKRG